MTTITIQIPDREAQEVLSYIKQKGGKVVEEISLAAVKRSQKASLKKGLTEAILISRGDMKGPAISTLG